MSAMPLSAGTMGAGASARPELAGSLSLRPGAPVGQNLRSTRRSALARLVRGQPAGVLPGLLGSLFNLCGQSHRLCSHLALEAATPGRWPPAPPARALQREAAAEHVRRIGLDWPRLLIPGQAGQPAIGDLRRCPWLATRAGAPVPWAEALDWLQACWLEMSPHTWLRLWQADGADWLRAWSERHEGWLALLLRAARPADMPLALAATPALRPHAEPVGMRTLGAWFTEDGADPMAPRWNGRPAHTGTWTRRHAEDGPVTETAWALLGWRIAELVRLSLPDEAARAGAGWLDWGAEALAPGEAVAWVEMARGLLVHYVRLTDDEGGRARVSDAQVLAPTDWNFDAHGVAAQALARLPAEDGPDPGPRVRLLMAALDPCVPFHLAGAATAAPAAPTMEAGHA
jgi:hypothetical protein